MSIEPITHEERRTVKKFLTMVMAAAFLSTVAVATAQTTTTPAPAPEKKAEQKAEKKATKKAHTMSASGTVKSAAADSIVVAGKAKGKETEWTFAVDPKTKIKKGGKDITAADLQAGDAVSVRYTEQDGKATAQSVIVKAAKKAAAKKSEETKPAADTGKK